MMVKSFSYVLNDTQIFHIGLISGPKQTAKTPLLIHFKNLTNDAQILRRKKEVDRKKSCINSPKSRFYLHFLVMNFVLFFHFGYHPFFSINHAKIHIICPLCLMIKYSNRE